MSDLLSHPLWQADSLGSALPDDEFGVSVSLPLWRHVIGYEEGDQDIVSKFRSGYPRFCCPPAVSQLFTAAEKDLASAGERCLVFPRLLQAERCVEFIARDGFTGRAASWHEGLGVAFFPAPAGTSDHSSLTFSRTLWGKVTGGGGKEGKPQAPNGSAGGSCALEALTYCSDGRTLARAPAACGCFAS